MVKIKALTLIIIALLLSGCSEYEEEKPADNVDIAEQNLCADDTAAYPEAIIKDEAVSAAEAAYRDLYNPIPGKSIESISSIIGELGKQGYTAVDHDNRINMTNPEKLRSFISMSEMGPDKDNQNEPVTALCISLDGSLTEYIFHSSKDGVLVERNQYMYDGTGLNLIMSSQYVPEVFKTTPEGYLMIKGKWDSEQMYVLALSEEEDHAALRVDPLDEDLRELTDKYILPISYGKNNLFITSWSNEDYGEVDFYDVFELLYGSFYHVPMPYVISDDLSAVYEYMVPQKELEDLVTSYFDIDADDLRSRLRYDADSQCYLFRPRGYSEGDYCEIPYPEVSGYTEENGVITLRVNAVFPNDSTSKLFSHEVTLSDFDGVITYLSNTVTIDNESSLWWHAPRLDVLEDDRNVVNIEAGPVSDTTPSADDNTWMLSAAKEDNFSEDEKNKIDEEALELYTSNAKKIMSGSKKEIVKALADNGVTVTSDNVNMENGSLLEDFYKNYLEGKQDVATVYDVKADGIVSALTFLFRNGALQTYYIAFGPDENNKPVLTGRIVEDLESVTMTPKGYFFYTYKNVLLHESLSRYFRVAPLPDKCREYADKYLSGLDLLKYDLLMKSWNEENVAEVLKPGLFGDLYYLKNKKWYNDDLDHIPADVFEGIMTTYLPADVRALRSVYPYDKKSDSYSAEDATGDPYPPFLEVTDHKQNHDGTITLYADGVWPDYMLDEAFKDVIVIMPLEGDDYRIISNTFTDNRE